MTTKFRLSKAKDIKRIFLKVTGVARNKEERDFYLNIDDVNVMFGEGADTYFWRTANSDANFISYKIKGMKLEQAQESLSALGVELVDLKDVHAELQNNRAQSKTLKPL